MRIPPHTPIKLDPKVSPAGASGVKSTPRVAGPHSGSGTQPTKVAEEKVSVSDAAVAKEAAQRTQSEQKVERLRGAIASGAFQIDPSRIADKLVGKD